MSRADGPYENVAQQLNTAADRMNLDPEIRIILPKTTNEIIVSLAIKTVLLPDTLCNAGGVSSWCTKSVGYSIR